MPDMCNFQETFDLALEPPPDSWAAHIDELPKPGTHVFGAQNALALALIYASMDPDVQQQLDNLRDDVQELASQNENLDAYSKMIYKAACRSQRELSKLQKHTVSLSQMVQTLAKQLGDAQTEILQANERVHGALEKRAVAVAESNDLRHQLQEAVSNWQTAASERDAVKTELEQAQQAREDENHSHMAFKSQIEAEVKLLRDEKVVQCAEMETVAAKLVEAKNAAKNLGDANARLVSELAVVNAARDALAETKAQLQSELLNAREEAHVLHQQLRNSESQHAKLEADRDNHRTKGAELEVQIGELIDGRDSLAAENTALQWTVRVVHDRNVVQADRLRDVELNRAALQSRCDGLQSGCDDARAVLDKFTSERELLEGEHRTLQGNYRDLQGENDALFLAIRDAETQRKTLEAERDGLVDARATLEQEGSTLRAELSETQSRCETLSELGRDLESAKCALHDARQTGAECMTQLRAAEAEVERLQRELEVKCQLVEESTGKLGGAERERGALQKELETVRANLATLQKSTSLSSQQTSSGPDEVKPVGESESQISHLHNSVAFWKAKFNTTISMVSTEKEKRETLEAGFRAEREEASRILAATRKVNDDWKREVQIARSEQDAMSRTQIALSKDNETLARQRDTLTKRRDALTEKHDALAKRYDALTKTHDGLRAELECARLQFERSLADSQAESVAKIAELMSQVDALGYANVGMNNTLMVGHRLVEDLQRQVQAALTERDRALEHRDALVKARDKLERDTKSAVENAVKRQAESRTALIAERKKVAAERDKVIAERDAISSERDQITEERNKLAAQYDVTCESLVAEQTMRRDAQRLHSSAALQLQDQQEQLKRQASQVAELKRQLEAKGPQFHNKKTQGEISKLRRELAETQNACQDALDEARFKVERMRNDLVQETAKSAQAEIKNLDLEKRFKSATEENANLTHKVEKLSRHLHSLRTRLDELRDVRAENELLCKQIDELENPKRKVSRTAA